MGLAVAGGAADSWLLARRAGAGFHGALVTVPPLRVHQLDEAGVVGRHGQLDAVAAPVQLLQQRRGQRRRHIRRIDAHVGQLTVGVPQAGVAVQSQHAAPGGNREHLLERSLNSSTTSLARRRAISTGNRSTTPPMYSCAPWRWLRKYSMSEIEMRAAAATGTLPSVSSSRATACRPQRGSLSGESMPASRAAARSPQNTVSAYSLRPARGWPTCSGPNSRRPPRMATSTVDSVGSGGNGSCGGSSNR